VSVSTAGVQGNDISGRFAGPAISGDGQVVAFDSIATTLVPNDTNLEADVFAHERASGVTERLSVSTAGAQANDSASRPAVDLDGDHVVFDSGATNLVSGDTNQALDVFLRDRAADTTQLVSVSSDEIQGNSASNSPSISDDGNLVAFVSTATNLVPNDTNNTNDIFVRDLAAGTTERVSVSTAGVEGNSSSTAVGISPNGRFVAFSSFASNLVSNDTNGAFDTFLHDRETGETQLVSVSSDEVQGDAQSVSPTVSDDGKVAFWSSATNLVPNDTNGRDDIFVRDTAAGTTDRVSVSSDEVESDGNSPEPGVRGFTASSPDITPDGRFVAFFSSATNLVLDDTNTCPLFFEDPPGACPDAFVRDLVAGTTTRVNVASDGTQANDRTADPVISNDGLVVAFFSAAGNLVPNDTNTCPLFASFPGNCPDIFVHDETGGGGGGSGTADLAVTQKDAPDPVHAKARLTYTITVTNNGPDAGTNVTLTDDLPATVRFLTATTPAGTCTLQSGDVVCELGTLASGGTDVVTVRVRPRKVSTIRNTVTVSAAETDPVAANNTDVESTMVVA
jgi:uncharacterized repeat protein (TIGR01451 family)